MENQKKLSLFEGYFCVLDTIFRKKVHYIWGIQFEKEGTYKTKHKKLWNHLKITILSSLLSNYLYLLFLWIPKNSKFKYKSTIARFDPIKNSWKKLGNLILARAGLGVIQLGNEFIVVGGNREGFEGIPTESCKLSGKSVTCTTREPQLSKFTHYPVLILIP